MLTDRRRFIKQAAALAAAAGPLARLAAEELPSGWRMRYRPLGRTGLQVSEVGLGGHYDGPGHEAKNATAQETRNAVVARALGLGVTFFDTNYDPERVSLGLALEGKRDGVILASDVNNEAGLDAVETRDNILKQINGHLTMLRTDRLDLFRLMAGVKHPTDEQMRGVLEAFRRLREEGKARFFALSVHDPAVLAERLKKHEEIDACYVPFSYVTSRAAKELFPIAVDRGVGVICIKPFAKGTLFQLPPDDAGLEGLPRDPSSLARANLKWVLSHQAVSTVIPGMESPAEVEDNALASGAGEVTTGERKLLEGISPLVRQSLPPHYAWLRRWHVS